MKLRHARAIAVFGIAVVALTGARGSHGGGCDNGGASHGSSSSTSGGTGGGSTTGGSQGDDDGTSTTGGGSLTGGSTSSGSTTGGSNGSTGGGKNTNPAQDIRIESCVYDDTRGVVARVSATNHSASTNYTYKFSVTFKDPGGTLLRTSNSTIPYVSPGSTDTLDVAASYVPQDGQDGSGSACKLSGVTRTAE